MQGPNKLRKDPNGNITGASPGSSRNPSPSPDASSFAHNAYRRPLRIVASGALFITHTLIVEDFPSESSNIRAQTAVRVRGGSAAATLSVLAQFNDVTPWLVAPIGSGPEGAALRIELEREGISTLLCPRRDNGGVPKAFVFRSTSTNSQTVVNHNPIVDITHDEYFRILGPLLYSTLSPSPLSGSETPRPRSPRNGAPLPPVEWFHFEGRAPQTTMENLQGLDAWHREKEWRGRVVLSVELGRPPRPGQESLMQFADVIFFSKAYALSKGHSSPRSFLLSIRPTAPPHALLILSWGTEGAGLLSMPTREYFQSSPFVPEPELDNDADLGAGGGGAGGVGRGRGEVEGSVRSSAVGIWDAGYTTGATGNASGTGTGNGTAQRTRNGSLQQDWTFVPQGGLPPSPWAGTGTNEEFGFEGEGNGEYWTEERRRRWAQSVGHSRGPSNNTTATSSGKRTEEEEELDESEADDAFIAGMIFALSRRILPGPPYTPSTSSSTPTSDPTRTTLSPHDIPPSGPRSPSADPLYEGRWRLDEALRFATEMAGRRMRRRESAGLALTMERVGWRM